MKNMMEYKGYHAKIEYSAEDRLFFGEVFGINDSLNFDGETVDELEVMFHNSIDDYLELCDKLGKEPDKEFKGTFNIRISPELHRKAALKANQLGISLNQLVSDAIEHELSGNQKTIREIIYIESEKQVEWSLAAYPFQNYSTASEVNFSREGAYTNARN